MIKTHRKKGFSFIEIAVVIAVLAVVVAILAPALISQVELSRMQKDESSMDEVCNAMQLALADSNTFDEAFSYCINNNYLTYSDSSGVYSKTIADEEFWAPDGAGAAVTITFNPENGKYDISKGIVNDMTYGNGSVAEKRTAEGNLQQCYFSEMGNQLLYSTIKQSIGETVYETSATYKNSSYTVFIRFHTVDGTRKADVYGQFNGTNLSEGCPAAEGSYTDSFDVDSAPISKNPTGGTKTSQFTNSDLSGGGSVSGGNSIPNYKLGDAHLWECINSETTRIEWNRIYAYYNGTFNDVGTDKWVTDNGNVLNTIAIAKWEISLNDYCDYELKYCVPTEHPNDYLQIKLNNNEEIRVTGSIPTERTLQLSLYPGKNTLEIRYEHRGLGGAAYIYLPDVIQTHEEHLCNNPKHVDETHQSEYTIQSSSVLATCTQNGQAIYKCNYSECTFEKSIDIHPTGHSFQSNDLCKICGEQKTYPISIGASNLHLIGYSDAVGEVIIPSTFSYNGKKYVVTGIPGFAFKNCKDLKTIVIPGSVTDIGRSAFEGCVSLETITIPDSVVNLGYFDAGTDGAVFLNCKSLNSVTFGQNISKIRGYMFCYCPNLKTITFNGTQSQWQKMPKGSLWNYGTSGVTIQYQQSE